MIGVCICGARGRMGRMLVELVEQAGDLTLVAALERPGHPELDLALGDGARLTDDARGAIESAGVVLDFSLPLSVSEHVALAAEAGKPFVSGTTGLDREQLDTIRRAAERIPVVQAFNMSRGIHLLGRLVAEAARSLAGHDAEIFEIHHAAKADAPSGTALKLAEIVTTERGGRRVYARAARRLPGEVGISSARGGDVVGEHQVMFLGPGEQLVLTHRATTREHFCTGALDALRFAARAAPGLYGMDEVFGES
ncbi:MAG TPA: 4-hydroxy-tetrahydrodipicolinate reductase [Myxococcota bacterium]|nr:4-hydroxy-tetrahydrodipicolinate reductase [Myxococcota bacterium]